jgi:TolB protein
LARAFLVWAAGADPQAIEINQPDQEMTTMRNLVTALRSTLHRLWVTVLLALLMGGIALVPDAAAQGGNGGSNGPQLTVLAEALNVRSGPGVTYAAVGLLARGDQVPLIGHHAASGWWQVQLPGDIAGWVSGGAAYISISGNAADLPEATAPVSAAAGVQSTASSTPRSTAKTGGTIVFQTVSGGAIYAVDAVTLTGTLARVAEPGRAGGSNLRYLTTGMDPALSPDGQWVAFTRWDDTQNGALGSLWIINVDGSGERAILGEIHQPKAPVWSPDGAQIIISMQHGGRVHEERKCTSRRPPPEAYDIEIKRDKDGDITFCFTLPVHPFWGLRVVDVDTGKFEDLPNDLFSYSPTWDPANAWHVVYDGDRGLVNLDLKQGTSWPLTDDVKDHSPVFSPDGSKIAVSYWQSDHWEIHVLNADGTGRVRLTQTSIRATLEQQVNGQMPKSWNNAAPAWSPDGSQIAFVTDRTGQWEIWIMNADGTNPHPLLPGEVQAGLKLQYNGMDERMLSWR